MNALPPTLDQLADRVVDPQWRERAFCNGHPHAELWDDTTDDGPDDPDRETDAARAKRHALATLHCRQSCPVRRDCAAAVAFDFRFAAIKGYGVPTGVRGGHLLPSFHAKDGNGSARDHELRKRLVEGADLDDAAPRADRLAKGRGRRTKAAAASDALVELTA